MDTSRPGGGSAPPVAIKNRMMAMIAAIAAVWPEFNDREVLALWNSRAEWWELIFIGDDPNGMEKLMAMPQASRGFRDLSVSPDGDIVPDVQNESSRRLWMEDGAVVVGAKP